MSNTPNLDLKLFGDTDLFSAFHAGLAGEGSGANKSNMQKIDEFAGQIDNNKANKSNVLTGTLSVAGWSSNTQTLTISGLVVSGYAYTVAPASASFNDYTAAVIYADDITTENQITFHCTNVPTAAVNVVILKVQVQ